MGSTPLGAGPPVPQQSDSQATSVPSFLAPTFTRANPEGRHPAVSNSSARSSRYFTGLPASFANCAQAKPQASIWNLLPKPPPMYRQMVWTLFAGMFRASANCAGVAETPWVEENV